MKETDSSAAPGASSGDDKNNAAESARVRALAIACADSMWANDACTKALGFEIKEVDAGFAVLTMRVRSDMLNGQGICHGGIVFTLADSSFAYACNAYNQFSVAQHCSVSFLKPIHENELLISTAREKFREGRSGIYDAVVTREDGEVVAEFRGHSRTVRGQHIPQGEST